MKRVLPFLAVTLLFFACKKQSNTSPDALPDAYSNQGVGQSAHDLLSADKYTAINIQVQYMPGFPLDTATITRVRDYLAMLCKKPGGVTITQTQIGANGDSITVERAAVLEKQNRTAYTSGTTLALYVMMADSYDTSVNILGFAYRNTSVCMIGKDIYDHSGGSGQMSRVSLECSVLEHELGHLLGLVNLGTQMLTPHQDVAHGNHCTNTACLMYWQLETHSVFHTIPNNTIPALDSNCRMDLTANGGL